MRCTWSGGEVNGQRPGLRDVDSPFHRHIVLSVCSARTQLRARYGPISTIPTNLTARFRDRGGVNRGAFDADQVFRCGIDANVERCPDNGSSTSAAFLVVFLWKVRYFLSYISTEACTKYCVERFPAGSIADDDRTPIIATRSLLNSNETSVVSSTALTNNWATAGCHCKPRPNPPFPHPRSEWTCSPMTCVGRSVGARANVVARQTNARPRRHAYRSAFPCFRSRFSMARTWLAIVSDNQLKLARSRLDHRTKIRVGCSSHNPSRNRSVDQERRYG